MKVNKFLTEIEKTYAKHFTQSHITVQYNTNLWRSIYVKCYLAKNQSECMHGISENDMFSIAFYITNDNGEFSRDITIDSQLPDDLVMKVTQKSYLIKHESQYMCYDKTRLPFRKTKGNSEKILKTLDKYFLTLKNSLKSDIKNNFIHDNHIELLTEKIS